MVSYDRGPPQGFILPVLGFEPMMAEGMLSPIGLRRINCFNFCETVTLYFFVE